MRSQKYRRWHRGTFVLVATVLCALVPAASASAARIVPVAKGRWVTVRPRGGLPTAPVRAFLPTPELRVVTRIGAMVDGMPADPGAGTSSFRLVTWAVEPGLGSSAALALQTRVLNQLAGFVDGAGAMSHDWQVHIIVGRTQDFIRQSLDAVGCQPGLSRSGGVVLMGATVCGRHVVISNLTGFLHLDQAGQPVTTALETMPEAPVRSTPYEVLLRTSGGLAHEFVHVWRASAVDGNIRPDEPAWFAEGLPEFWSGVATVRSGALGGTYAARHVMRLRNFVDVRRVCAGPLASYSAGSPSGCEYHLGLMAVEYLIATRSNLVASAAALAASGRYDTFGAWFEASYGITVDQFQTEFDRYAAAVRAGSGL